MIRKAIVVAVLLALGACGPAPAQKQEKTTATSQLDLAAAAYAQGNHAEALKWWRLAADQGNADAQLNLGFMYNPRECLVRGSL